MQTSSSRHDLVSKRYHARLVLRGLRTLIRLVGRILRLMIWAGYRRFVDWLDTRFFGAVVAYATHPLVILATMLLLIPLIAFASATALVLILGNYTNVVSASVSSIVLLQGIKQHRATTRMHREHAAQLAALHEKFVALSPIATPAPPAASSPPVAAPIAHRRRGTVAP